MGLDARPLLRFILVLHILGNLLTQLSQNHNSYPSKKQTIMNSKIFHNFQAFE